MKTQPRQHISNKYNSCTVVTRNPGRFGPGSFRPGRFGLGRFGQFLDLAKIRPKRPTKFGRNDPGPKRPRPKRPGPKRPRAEMTQGRNDSGPKRPGTVTSPVYIGSKTTTTTYIVRNKKVWPDACRFRFICIFSFAYTNKKSSYLVHHEEFRKLLIFVGIYRTTFCFLTTVRNAKRNAVKDSFLEV